MSPRIYLDYNASTPIDSDKSHPDGVHREDFYRDAEASAEVPMNLIGTKAH